MSKKGRKYVENNNHLNKIGLGITIPGTILLSIFALNRPSTILAGLLAIEVALIFMFAIDMLGDSPGRE